MLSQFKKKLQFFFRSVKGATAIEYCLLMAGIAMVMAVSVFALGDTLQAFFAGLPAVFTGG